MHLVGMVIAWVLRVYLIVLFARMFLSWIPVFAPRFEPRGMVAVLFEVVYSLTEPPLRFARKLLPSGPSFGGVRLDLGFLVIFVVVLALIRIATWIFLR